MTKTILYLAAISANLGLLASGLFFGWVSPVLPLYGKDGSPMTITDSDVSWIVALFTAGGAFGSALSAIASNKIGRKLTMLSSLIPSIAGWLMIIYAKEPWHLYLSRFISGIGIAPCYVTTPMYLGEISPANIRGTLLTGIQIAAKTGVLIEYSFAPFVSIEMGALISLMFPLLFGLTFMWLPESPYFLIRQGQQEKARKSLSRFRGKKNVDQELKVIEKSVSAELASGVGFKDIFCIPGNRRALNISLMLIIIQQLSGTQAVIAYPHKIFSESGKAYLTIALGCVTVICTIVCAFFVDRMGRRPLLMSSSIGAFLTMSSLAIYFHLKLEGLITSAFDWVPAVSVMLYAVSYAIGLAALPFAMMGELFPTNVKALGCAIAIVVVNLAATVVTKTFQIIETEIGIHAAFWLYAFSSLGGTIYIYYCVPETKGKTLQQIQDELHFVKK